MPTTTDFVRWKLKGPEGAPVPGFEYIGSVRDRFELFYNKKNDTFYCRAIGAVTGVDWPRERLVKNKPRYYGKAKGLPPHEQIGWNVFFDFIEDYDRCLQSQDSQKLG